MRIIAITLPHAIDNEVATIRRLLAGGIDVIHLRKPEAGVEYCRHIVGQLSPAQRSKIVIHDYYELYADYALRGVHLNRNITHLPDSYHGSRTRSCHTFEEVVRYKDECNYLFLSPIFDSISKSGYQSGFTHDELLEAAREGIIDERVIALGGVTPNKITYLESLHFGGVAMSGALFCNDRGFRHSTPLQY